MTKDKYIYELIDKCMVIACQNNILIENFALCDEYYFYEEMERQFLECLKLYDDMRELQIRNEINENVLEQELRTALAKMRQAAIKRLLEDFRKIFVQMDIQNREALIEELKNELQSKNIDAEYLLIKVQMIRKMEQDNSTRKRGAK